MKVSEPDENIVLMVSDRLQVTTEIAKPRSGVNNGNTIRICGRDLKTGGVAAEFLEANITDWDGAADTVKFELHTQRYGQVDSSGKLGVRILLSLQLGETMPAFASGKFFTNRLGSVSTESVDFLKRCEADAAF